MKKHFLVLISTFCILLFGGCASIPQESVMLSQQIGKGITAQYNSEMELVNQYFLFKRAQLDKALEKSYNAYFGIMAEGLDGQTITADMLKGIKEDVLARQANHQKSLQELEKTRLILVRKLDEQYVQLSKANLVLTDLLQSAVDIDQAKRQVYEQVSEATGGKVDISGALDKIDSAIEDHGDHIEKALELSNKVKDFLEEHKENEND